MTYTLKNLKGVSKKGQINFLQNRSITKFINIFNSKIKIEFIHKKKI